MGRPKKLEGIDDAKARKERALADKREIEVQRQRGELVPMSAVRDAEVRLAHMLRDALLAIPSRTAMTLASMGSAHEIQELLEVELRGALAALSAGFDLGREGDVQAHDEDADG